MREFLNYDQKYPDLVARLIEFFKNNSKGEKTVVDFCESYKVPEGEDKIQPMIIGRICDRLWERSILYCITSGLGLRTKDSYSSLGIDQGLYNKFPDLVNHRLNSIVYGFEYIYTHYKERTIPVVVKIGEDDSMGTCFRIFNGIATAKHCLTDGKPVAIRGYSKERLQRCSVYISKNPGIDLAFIATGENHIPNDAEPHVLDDVLVMGYPKVSWFLEFCTGEKANISAMADLRLTPTLGSVAAEGEIYSPRGLPKMLLVTAKIAGGNSGGPVINEEGYVVGISTNISDGTGLSDDHVGYGVAYPIQALVDMIKEDNKIEVEFSDWPY